MKKLLLILLSLTLCACQAPTKSTTSTSKKACDVTSEEEKCNEKDNTKTNFKESRKRQWNRHPICKSKRRRKESSLYR